jgi:hypothetical protein
MKSVDETPQGTMAKKPIRKPVFSYNKKHA